MEIVFDVVSRAGKLLERHRATGPSVSIGRALSNKVILADPTVSPHHAVLEISAQDTLILRDLNSLNGTRTDHEKITGSTPVISGAELSLGRTRVRIYSANHPVADTVAINSLDGVTNLLSLPRVLGVLAITVFAFTLFEVWARSHSGMQWNEATLAVLFMAGTSLCAASVLAVVGRVAKQEGHFSTQLALVFCYLIVQRVLVWLYELVLFNSLESTLSLIFGFVSSVALLATATWFALRIATNLDERERGRFALVLALAVGCFSVLPGVFEREEFSASPDYVRVIKPPILRFREGQNFQSFMHEAEKLYSETNHQDKL